MPKFKEYNQYQSMFLPPSLKDCLPSDHFAFLINDAVDNLDLSKIEETYSEKGSPAYDPRGMIKILFYGYSQKITSLRKIEQACCDNIAFRFLSANRQPDHGTINLFRKVHLKNLKNIFSQIVIFTGKIGIADLSDISVDGTKNKANASKKNLYDRDRIEKLKEKIGKDLEEAIKLDEEEDKKFGVNRVGYNQLPEELADPEKRKIAIKKAKEELEKIEKAEQEIQKKQEVAKTNEDKKAKKNSTTNTTDADSNLMKMKDKSYQMAYNIQVASSKQIVLAYDVNNEPTDSGQFQTMIEQTEEMTNTKVEKAKSDSGYFSKKDLQYSKESGIDLYMPDQMKAKEERDERENKISKYDRRNFKYDEQNDQLICPEGHPLVLQGKDKNKGARYVCGDCSRCPAKSKCAKGKNRNFYYDPEFERLKTEMRAKLNTEEGKAKYLERMSEIEPVFGQTKENQGFIKFHTRGKPMVLIETGLHYTAHNLTKIFHWMKKNKKEGKEIQWNTLMRLRTAE